MRFVGLLLFGCLVIGAAVAQDQAVFAAKATSKFVNFPGLPTCMGAGLCVLTSDVPENREVVDGAGYTFKRGDSDDLAERLRFLISNPAVREAAGNAARRRIEEQYQWQKIATDIEKAYLQILGRSEQKLPARKQSVRAVPSTQSRDKDRRAG